MALTTKIVFTTLVLKLCIILNLSAQVTLHKVGEFRINSLNRLDIVDFDAGTKTYLAYAPKIRGFEVYLINNQGKILEKKNFQGQGPGQFNSAMNFLGFSDSGSIWIITANQLITYDLQLNFKESIKFKLEDPFITSMLTTAPVFFYPGGKKENLVLATYPSLTSRFMTATSLEKHFLVQMFDMQSNNSFYLASIKERDIYGKLDKSVFPIYAPIFTIDKSNNKIYVTATLDSEVSIIDLPSRKVVSNIKINHGRFGSFDKFPISEKTLPKNSRFTLASMNRKLLSLEGGMFVLDYVREIGNELFNNELSEDPNYHHFKDPQYHRLIFFDQNKQLSEDIPMPKNAHLMISLPDDRLLFKIVNTDLEEDFVRYEIYQIVKN